MLPLLQEYAPVIIALAAVGIFAVLVVDLQMLLRHLNHHTRSSILITRGRGTGLDAECEIANTSTSVIYASHVIIAIKSDTETWREAIDDLRETTNSQEGRYVSSQKPIGSGGSMVLGTFKDFVDLTLRRRFGEDWDENRYEDIRSIMVTAVANFSTFERPVGACREFYRVKEHGTVRMRPTEIHTTQCRSKKECRQLVGDLERYF